MFIKLTRWKRDNAHGEPVYLNPLTITSIKANESYTNVDTVDGGWSIMETPEEITSQVESVAKYYLSMLKG